MGAELGQKGGSGAMRKKLRSARGETLVELLCAILIGSLSVALLFGMVTASGNMDRSARAADKTFNESLNGAEARTSALAAVPAGAEVTVGNEDVTPDTATPSVKFYGGGGAVSYALSPP